MNKKILIVNGPNLNMLGKREINIYGDITLDEINQYLVNLAKQLSVEVDFFQSNHEGEIIDRIHDCMGTIDFIIINPGALTHYSIALLDALKSVNIPYIEVHLSNIYAREQFRHQSIIASGAIGGIYGLGKNSYILALQAAISYLKEL